VIVLFDIHTQSICHLSNNVNYYFQFPTSILSIKLDTYRAGTDPIRVYILTLVNCCKWNVSSESLSMSDERDTSVSVRGACWLERELNLAFSYFFYSFSVYSLCLFKRMFAQSHG
jgi:hypothetical protein